MGRVHWRHRMLERRMRRSCYYPNGRPLDRISLPLTEAAVEYFAKNAPFDDLDLQYASDVSYAGAVSPSVLIVAMIYIERMRLTNKDHFESSDPADLFTTALLCASKFLYDEAETEFVYNDEWALSCSRTLDHVNKNEVEFLNALQWNTMAREKDFYQMLRNMEKAVAKNECQWRGFASYSDLAVLASSMNEIWNEILLPALAVIGMATLTYTATVVGLYTCSLHSQSVDLSETASPLLSVVSLPSFSMSSAHLSPSISSQPVIQPLPTPMTTTMRVVRSAAKTRTEREKNSPVVEKTPTYSKSNLYRFLLKPKQHNESLCGKVMMNENDVLSPTPWAAWFLHAKPTFAIWSF